MRFNELSIQTQRSAPSEIHSDGFAFLYRAGYLSRLGDLLPLGQMAITRLRDTQAVSELPGMLTSLGLPFAHSVDSNEYFDRLAALPKYISNYVSCPGA